MLVRITLDPPATLRLSTPETAESISAKSVLSNPPQSLAVVGLPTDGWVSVRFWVKVEMIASCYVCGGEAIGLGMRDSQP